MIRLPHRPSTKAKIREALTGHTRTPEERAAISAGLKGRKLSEETKTKLRAARVSRSSQLEYTRARKRAETKARLEQWRKDKYTALRVCKDRALVEDIIASEGWRSKRTRFDPRVSPGYGEPARTGPKRLEDQWVELMLQRTGDVSDYWYGGRLV